MLCAHRVSVKEGTPSFVGYAHASLVSYAHARQCSNGAVPERWKLHIFVQDEKELGWNMHLSWGGKFLPPPWESSLVWLQQT